MANNIPSVNSANTLSLFARPGEDKRLFNTNSDSIFTFGDFRIYRNNDTDSLTGTTQNLNFDTFSTLESLGSAQFTPPQSYSVNYNELNFPLNNPYSYSYFGSFYTEVANSINNIIESFPYAILSVTGNSAVTLYNYSYSINNITGQKISTFRIPYATLINQGNIILNSGSTIVSALSLVDNFTEFSIQVTNPATGITGQVANIISYNFSAGVGSYLEFTVDNVLNDISGSTTNLPIYIRPTKQRLAEYKLKISKLEYNLLYGGKLIVPNVETDDSESEQTFEWPTTIDKFSPDSYGTSFNTYRDSVLKAASDIDDSKTNIMLKTMIPENFLEMDSQNAIYRRVVQAYAHEFDEIKHFIDGIAFAHSIEYNGENSIPTKFINKLSKLLGWKLSDSFNEIDLFEYLAGDADGKGTSFSQFNMEIWRRILININWLYKKKGTRDALTFLFKLLGAPACLIEFEEFVYKINQVGSNASNSALTNSQKVNENGYINFGNSDFIFQEGGEGRGNGHDYIYQWIPEFDPIKQVDNIKSVVGDDSVFGSQNIVNTKELNISINPATAIERDVFSFYQLSGTCGTPGTGNTIPIEYTVDCDNVKPDNIEKLTLIQWLDYVYSSSIDPRNRKVVGKGSTMSTYVKLKNAYLNYYYWNSPKSNRLTFSKLQGFLDSIGRSFTDYTNQLLPATVVLASQARTIRNTVFNRQKFVYREGINLGSEFKVGLSNYSSTIIPFDINTQINDYYTGSLSPAKVIGTINSGTHKNLAGFQITMTVVTGYQTQINAFSVSTTINPSTEKVTLIQPAI